MDRRPERGGKLPNRIGFVMPKLLELVREEKVCWLCNKPVAIEDATRDHVIPKSLGGIGHRSNLRLAHADCNRLRGNGGFDNKGPETRKELLYRQFFTCAFCPDSIEHNNSHKFKNDRAKPHSLQNTFLLCNECRHIEARRIREEINGLAD
jgi:5-methylcytosine-specific restriction endonuclease McrA